MEFPKKEYQETMVESWNKNHSPGVEVVVILDSGEYIETTTRSEAWMLGGHSPVILVEGVNGAYSLSRVRLKRLDEQCAASRACDELPERDYYCGDSPDC